MPHASGEAHIGFEHVCKTYDGRTLVVDDLNLEIHKGEFLTLLGPSGSGKTTSLMMLAGFEQPTSGTILVKGNPIDRLPAYKRDMGMVFQNYALFPHMTIEENLAFPLIVRKLPGSDVKKRVSRALDMVRLPGVEGRRPNQLSGGQQQRIAVARALVFQPEIVLMDEPLGALDKNLREQMQYELRSIHRELGVTLVYVTHDQSEALTMSDRIAVFGNGKIQQLANPSDLYESPQNHFVAAFVGESNLLECRIDRIEAGACTILLSNGERIEATPIDVSSADPMAILSLRPERVLVGAAATAAPNRLRARIAETIYVGDHLRVKCALQGGIEIVVKLANVYSAGLGEFGSEIDIGFRSEDCLVLRLDGAAAGHREPPS